MSSLVTLIRRLIRHEVVKNALLLYGVQLSGYIFPLIALPYLSRVLNPEKFGLVAFAQMFMWYFVTLTEYGFNLTATRRIAIHRDDPEIVSLTFNSVMQAKGLLCGVGFVIMAVSVLLVPKFRPDWLLYFVSYLAVVGNWLFPVWLFQGLQKLEHVAYRDFGAKLISLVALFLFVRKESDYLLAAGLQSGAMMVAGLLGLATVPFITRVRFAWVPWREVKARLMEGAPIFLSMAALTLYSSTNTLILGFVSNNREVGYFSGAWRIIVSLRMLVAPIATALYPHISHMANRSKPDAIRFLRKYSLLLSAPFFAGGLLLLTTAPFFVPLLLGLKFAPSTLLVQIMAFSPFFCAMSHSYTTYYMLAFGYDKEWSKIVVGGVVLNFILMGWLLWLMPPGVAVATVTTLTDVYAVAVPFYFYMKTSSRHSEVATIAS